MTTLSYSALQKATTHPARVAIIQAIKDGMDNTKDLCIHCRLLPYQVRNHLVILRRAGIVQMKATGKQYHNLSLTEAPASQNS